MAVYDYLTLTLARGPAARAEFVKAAKAAGLADGGKVAGLFTAQLGWAAAEFALLVERSEGQTGPPAALRSLARAPEVVSYAFQELTPTIRPGPGAVLKPGGIYVHRWFEVMAGAADEFVALSAEAWSGFEGGFDAQIFGLFELTSPETGPSHQLFLITRYGSHGIWEDSRDPTTEAMKTFARRTALTLSTRGASTLLIAL
jgi:hypothetical protein